MASRSPASSSSIVHRIRRGELSTSTSSSRVYLPGRPSVQVKFKLDVVHHVFFIAHVDIVVVDDDDDDEDDDI